jgi:hypothetical protein
VTDVLNEQGFLANLNPAFRHEVEMSAAQIVTRIGAATVERLESLAAMAANEALQAYSHHQAQTAFALAAELKRRALLLAH